LGLQIDFVGLDRIVTLSSEPQMTTWEAHFVDTAFLGRLASSLRRSKPALLDATSQRSAATVSVAGVIAATRRATTSAAASATAPERSPLLAFGVCGLRTIYGRHAIDLVLVELPGDRFLDLHAGQEPVRVANDPFSVSSMEKPASE